MTAYCDSCQTLLQCDEETFAWHKIHCGIAGGETREIPAIVLVNGKIRRGEI